VLEDLPDLDSALNVSRQAAHEAEHCGADSRHLWLVEGLAFAALTLRLPPDHSEHSSMPKKTQLSDIQSA